MNLATSTLMIEKFRSFKCPWTRSRGSALNNLTHYRSLSLSRAMFGRLEALEAENLENADYSSKYLLCHKTDIFNGSRWWHFIWMKRTFLCLVDSWQQERIFLVEVFEAMLVGCFKLMLKFLSFSHHSRFLSIVYGNHFDNNSII